MTQSFLTQTNPTLLISADKDSQAIEPNREPVRLMAIGSRDGVLRVIHTLHHLRFAEVREWSPLLPAPTPGEVMSILTRYLTKN